MIAILLKLINEKSEVTTMLMMMDSTLTLIVIGESDNNSVIFSAILSHPAMSLRLHSMMQTMQDGSLAHLAKQACAEYCKIQKSLGEEEQDYPSLQRRRVLQAGTSQNQWLTHAVHIDHNNAIAVTLQMCGFTQTARLMDHNVLWMYDCCILYSLYAVTMVIQCETTVF